MEPTRPFPFARPSEALLEEDKFMKDHSGAACRWVYRLLNPLSGWPRARRRPPAAEPPQRHPAPPPVRR